MVHVFVGVGDLDLGVGVGRTGAVDLSQPVEQDVLGLDERQLSVVPLAGAEDVGAVVRVEDRPVVAVGPGDESTGRLVAGDVEAGFLSCFESKLSAWTKE